MQHTTFWSAYVMEQQLKSFKTAYYQLETRCRPPLMQSVTALSVELAYLAQVDDRQQVKNEYLQAKLEPVKIDPKRVWSDAQVAMWFKTRRDMGLTRLLIVRAVNAWHVLVVNRAVAMVEETFRLYMDAGLMLSYLDPLLVYAVHVCQHERNAEFIRHELQATALLEMAYTVAVRGVPAALAYGSLIAKAGASLVHDAEA